MEEVNSMERREKRGRIWGRNERENNIKEWRDKKPEKEGSEGIKRRKGRKECRGGKEEGNNMEEEENRRKEGRGEK